MLNELNVEKGIVLIVEKDGLNVVKVEKGENKLVVDVDEVKGFSTGTEVYELVSEPMEKGKKGEKGLNGKNELDGKNDGNRLVGKVGATGLIGDTDGLIG